MSYRYLTYLYTKQAYTSIPMHLSMTFLIRDTNGSLCNILQKEGLQLIKFFTFKQLSNITSLILTTIISLILTFIQVIYSKTFMQHM